MNWCRKDESGEVAHIQENGRRNAEREREAKCCENLIMIERRMLGASGGKRGTESGTVRKSDSGRWNTG